MKEVKQEVKLQEFSIHELSPIETELMEQAIVAGKNAYAPYSNFHVGVAILLDNDIIVTGNNQENAAYPSGLCAERVAIFHASSLYPNVPIRYIAIVALSKDGIIKESISPCGACRQVLLEYESLNNTPIRILFCGKQKAWISPSVKNLLPFAFTNNNLY